MLGCIPDMNYNMRRRLVPVEIPWCGVIVIGRVVITRVLGLRETSSVNSYGSRCGVLNLGKLTLKYW